MAAEFPWRALLCQGGARAFLSRELALSAPSQGQRSCAEPTGAHSAPPFHHWGSPALGRLQVCFFRADAELGSLPDSNLQLPFTSQLLLIMSPSNFFFFKLHTNRSCATPVFSFLLSPVTVIQNTHRTNGGLTFLLTKQGFEGDSLKKYLFL